MSWSDIVDPYSEFQSGLSDPWQTLRFLRPLDSYMDIWELSEIFETFDIPRAFAIESVHHVAHSFGTQSHRDGSFCAWFHFLCKNIDVNFSGTSPRIENRVRLTSTSPKLFRNGNWSRKSGSEIKDLPQADFSWLRSGFFLKVEPVDRGKGITLICFGATPHVRKSLEMWIESKQWDSIHETPLSLLDLVVEGMFREVDTTIWKMGHVFGPMETSILQAASAGFPALEQEVEFIGLHNCLKHTIYLTESVDACLALIDRIKSFAQTTVIDPRGTSSPLLASLSHWRTLFTSTSLRLSSLHRRVENLTGLCFNLVTQQDSMILRHESQTMRQDATAMKVLASITVLFLPTMALASILGSQLFVTTLNNEDDKTSDLEVRATPLFNVLWMFSIPMTILVIMLAAAWSWYSHANYPKTSAQMKERLENAQTALPCWVLILKNAFELLYARATRGGS
ncbi:hypothetical protein TWF281_001484 [Arthrobotrys megalospora]